MKRIVQEPGVRKWSGEDFLALQEEPLKVLDLMFKPYGSCIIEGCEVVGNEIKPGIVALEGVDVNGQPTFKVVPFSGADDIPNLPAYLYLAVDTDVREYADGDVRPVSHSYYAKVAFTTPPANSIAINSAGKGRRLLDAIQDNERRFVTDAEKNTWSSKASTAVASTSANGLMSSADKIKLNGVAANATNYTHPSTHPASMITESSSKRFVSDAEKSTWNAKASTAVASTSANGLMSSADKTKLNGVAANATNYTHPSTHPASMITESSSKRFVSDTEKNIWNSKASTAVASTNANGLMSSADKTKLNKYPADGKGWGQMNAPTSLGSIEEIDACREIGFYGVSHGSLIGEDSGDGGLFVMGGRNDTKQIAWNLTNVLKFRGNDKPQTANSAWSPWYDFWHSGNSEQFTSAEKTNLNNMVQTINSIVKSALDSQIRISSIAPSLPKRGDIWIKH